MPRQSQAQITQGAQAKLDMVADLADRHGLSLKEAKTLMRYNSPQEMQMGAQILASQRRAQSSQAAEIEALKAQVAKLTQAAPQKFDSGQGVGTSGLNSATYAERLKNGGAPPTPAETDRMTAQWIRG